MDLSGDISGSKRELSLLKGRLPLFTEPPRGRLSGKLARWGALYPGLPSGGGALPRGAWGQDRRRGGLPFGGRFWKNGIETHQALFGAGTWVIEGLYLSGVESGEYELTCVPLKVEDGDGAPARAILRK